MTEAERQTVIDALELALKWSEQNGVNDFCVRALDIMRRESACKYPECVDNGPDGKCVAWLIGECEGPKD